ncbi:hypothetical protein V1264_007355 [Littorina saxatilis]
MCCCVPLVCPLCRQDTSVTPMRIPPYILPSPFIASNKARCSIVLKPTLGDFVRNYTHTADLHIGVTDSRGCCHDFDEEGFHVGGIWQQCLAIPMVTQTSLQGGLTPSSWDHSLGIFADPNNWTVQRYHERDRNCFDFVLQFLCYAGLQQVLGHKVLADKEVFCHEFLQQRTHKASQYVNLYRRVLNEGYVLDVAKF